MHVVALWRLATSVNAQNENPIPPSRNIYHIPYICYILYMNAPEKRTHLTLRINAACKQTRVFYNEWSTRIPDTQTPTRDFNVPACESRMRAAV